MNEQMAEVKLPTRAALVDKNPQPTLEMSGSSKERHLNKFVFTHRDDPNLGPKKRIVLYTCSSEDYPYIRKRLTEMFPTFVALLNKNSVSRGEAELNSSNERMLSVLRNDDRTCDIFIIPLQKLARGLAPIGGVRFVTSRFSNRGNANAGGVKLIMGDTRMSIRSRSIDFYHRPDPSETGTQECSVSEMSVIVGG